MLRCREDYSSTILSHHALCTQQVYLLYLQLFCEEEGGYNVLLMLTTALCVCVCACVCTLYVCITLMSIHVKYILHSLSMNLHCLW